MTGNNTIRTVKELESLEKEICNLPLIFTEMFKDEINANDEHRMFNGVKRIVKKYGDDAKALSVVNEFTRVICGGTSLEEIFQLTRDEAKNPTALTDITIDNRCKHGNGTVAE